MVNAYLTACSGNLMMQLTVVAVVIDTIFGVLRAIKEHRLNTTIGIDGAIRKAGMLVSLLFFQLIDLMVHINLIGFIPEEARAHLGGQVGTTEFFALLFVAYEATSILKNMALCGLPVRRVWEAVRKFLEKYTDELPAGAEALPPNGSRTEDVNKDAQGEKEGDEDE